MFSSGRQSRGGHVDGDEANLAPGLCSGKVASGLAEREGVQGEYHWQSPGVGPLLAVQCAVNMR